MATKKSIFDIYKPELTADDIAYQATDLQNVRDMLFHVLNEEQGCIFVNPIEQMTRGFNKKILEELNDVSVSLFGVKKVHRTVKYERGIKSHTPLTEHRKEDYWISFWVDMIECPPEVQGLNSLDAKMKFERLIMDHIPVQQKKEFMESMGHKYIIHYDYHLIFDIIKNTH